MVCFHVVRVFFSFTVSFSCCLIMPTLFWGDKDSVALMNNLQLLQNKAAKTILDRPFHSSAADALEALGCMVNPGETQTISSLPLAINVLMRSQPTV